MAKDVFIFAEQRDGVVQKVALELTSKARELADQLNQAVTAILPGYDIGDAAAELIAYGADRVLVIDNPLLAEYTTEPYAKCIQTVIAACEPEIVLYGATSIGRDLAPRVSARVKTGLTADCTSLAIEEGSGLLLMTRPAFGGNIMATIVCPEHRPQMATVRPGVMKLAVADAKRQGEVLPFAVELKEDELYIKVRDVKKNQRKHRDISEAKILVSGGRGIGGPEAFAKLKKLADALDGEVASSRACVDAQWIDHECQVGQTGKTVRPKLYMACGISGAIQHLAGMEESEFIIAVNKDETAPIFEVADVGIVGDLHEILPLLEDGIRNYKTAKRG